MPGTSAILFNAVKPAGGPIWRVHRGPGETKPAFACQFKSAIVDKSQAVVAPDDRESILHGISQNPKTFSHRASGFLSSAPFLSSTPTVYAADYTRSPFACATCRLGDERHKIRSSASCPGRRHPPETAL